MRTTRVFECPRCHGEIVEPLHGPNQARTRSGEFAATVVHCPRCDLDVEYDTGAAQSGDSPASAIVPCERCGTVVEAYGTSERFIRHVVANPELHDLHRR